MTKIKCPVCETTNEAGRKECQHCGAPLPQVRVQSGGSGPKPAAPEQPQSANQATFRKGQLVANRYTIMDIVGKGGMGCIYKVYDNTLKEQVALKTLLPQYLRDKMVVERFFNEARIARQLSHPNIVRVHDIGVADQMLYISMEYLQGKSLRGMLEELLPGERMPVADTLKIMIDLCTALEYAHQYTVHRDLKPENVMITPDGTLKLMDFGISKLMTTGKLTATAVVMGTPHYMPPEQFRDSSTVDARADIYSIGVILYEILTGNLPTGVPKPASQIMRDIPPALDPIVAKCVEPNPGDRYANVTDLKQALSDVLTVMRGGTLESKAARAAAAASSESTRKVIGAALIAAVLLVTALGVYGLEGRRQRVLAEAAQAAPSAPDAGQPTQSTAQMDELFSLVESARAAVETKELTDQTRPIRERADSLADAADKQRAKNPDRASRAAEQALQCYLALVMPHPDDAFFVMPRDSEDGFFIFRRLVTLGEFCDWSTSTQWRALPDPDPSLRDQPVNNVSFYDAQAYAADHGMRVQSKAEWQRAFEVEPDAFASGIHEWTRDVVGGPTEPNGMPRFGSQLATAAVSVDADGKPIGPEFLQRDYSAPDAQLGFRCVIPIPLSTESVRQIVGS